MSSSEDESALRSPWTSPSGSRGSDEDAARRRSWYDDETFAKRAKGTTSDSGLSLYDLILSRKPRNRTPTSSRASSRSSRTSREKTTRGFFRRWGLDAFAKLTRYRLPILCCEMIIEPRSNRDLWRLCMAAQG
uniref:Uncharacterized protein n=1 Tax=Trichogramma kaykai TaxID=54128 RepID=A0ABD2WQI8_9HYME